MVLIHRWSLYAGLITWKSYPLGPVKCKCLYEQVISTWSFRASLSINERKVLSCREK